MGDVDVRKPDRPDNDGAEQGGEHRRGESVGSGEGLRPDGRSGADDVRLHDRIRGWGDFDTFTRCGQASPEPGLPAKC
jgi:hypothetical protein